MPTRRTTTRACIRSTLERSSFGVFGFSPAGDGLRDALDPR